jgi:hypothetical protein
MPSTMGDQHEKPTVIGGHQLTTCRPAVVADGDDQGALPVGRGWGEPGQHNSDSEENRPSDGADRGDSNLTADTASAIATPFFELGAAHLYSVTGYARGGDDRGHERAE